MAKVQIELSDEILEILKYKSKEENKPLEELCVRAIEECCINNKIILDKPEAEFEKLKIEVDRFIESYKGFFKLDDIPYFRIRFTQNHETLGMGRNMREHFYNSVKNGDFAKVSIHMIISKSGSEIKRKMPSSTIIYKIK